VNQAHIHGVREIRSACDDHVGAARDYEARVTAEKDIFKDCVNGCKFKLADSISVTRLEHEKLGPPRWAGGGFAYLRIH
jgi:hypothetical protein